MPGPRFFRMAHRMPAYRGVMRERVTALAREQEGAQQPSAAAYSPAQASGGGRRVVPGTRAALQADPVMAGVFSFG